MHVETWLEVKYEPFQSYLSFSWKRVPQTRYKLDKFYSLFLFWLWVLNSRILILSLFRSFSCLTIIWLLTAAPYNTNLYVLWCSIRVHVQLINVWCQGKLYAMHIRQPVINLANLKYCSRLSVNSWSKEDWFS